MNWKVLKDTKTVFSFVIALCLMVVSIIFASNDDSVWVFWLFIGFITLSYAVMRAHKLTHE